MVEGIMGSDIDLGTLTEAMHILAYDVPSETRSSVKDVPKTQEFLMAERSKIQKFLNNGLDTEKRTGVKSLMVPPANMLQKSLYRIHPDHLDAVKDKVELWLREYEEMGFQARIKVFPIATNQEGYKTFLSMQIDSVFEKMTGQEELIEKAIDLGECPGKTKNQIETMLNTIENMIELYFGELDTNGRPNHDYNQDTYTSMVDELKYVRERFLEMSRTVTIVLSWTKKAKKADE
jgi:hypothetical protein